MTNSEKVAAWAYYLASSPARDPNYAEDVAENLVDISSLPWTNSKSEKEEWEGA